MPIQPRLLLLFTFILLGITSFSQEICNNSIDDDGDGLIDLNDILECSCTQNATITDGFLLNPSFEDKNCCPSTTGLNCVNSWVDGVILETSDYFHSCGSPGSAPKPIPDGSGYIGFINMVAGSSNKAYKEYIGQCLQKPLKSGESTTLEFYLSGSSAGTLPLKMAIFGTTSCSTLPGGVAGQYDFGCPTNGSGFIELGSVSATPNNSNWDKLSITFTPSQNIAAVVIGPDCTPGAVATTSNAQNLYYFMDNLKLTQTTSAPPAETAQISLTGSVCVGNQQLTSQTSILLGSYQWYKNGIAIFGASASNYTLPAGSTTTGDYQVYVTGLNKCALSNILSITGAGSNTPDFTFTSNCSDRKIDFTDASSGSSIKSLEWNFGDNSSSSLQQNPSHTYSSDGTFKVKLIITSNQNCKDSIEKTIQISNDKPTASFSFINACEGLPLSFTNTSVSTSGIAIFNWDFEGIGTSSQSNPSYTFNSSGTKTVIFSITDNSGCQDDTTMQIILNASPQVNFSTKDTCTGSVIDFTNTSTISTGSIQSFLWDFGDNSPLSMLNLPTHKYTTPGTYSVSLIAISDKNCTDTLQKQITQYPIPIADFLPLVACQGDSTQFSDQSSVSGGSINKWTWNFGDPLSGTKNTGYTKNIKHNYPLGPFYVTLAIESDKGCKDDTIKNLTIISPPIADFSHQDSCFGNEPIRFNNSSTSSSGNSLNKWEWSFGDGTTSTQKDPTHLYSSTGVYITKLVVTTVNNCTDTVDKSVTIYPSPTASFSSDKIEGCAPFCVNFISNSSISGGTISSLNWGFGNITLSNSQTPNECYESAGNHSVSLIVTSDKGCTDTLKKDNYINALPGISADFYSKTDQSDIISSKTYFTDITSGNPSTWNWTFYTLSDTVLMGNSFDQNPYYIFPTDTGQYLAKLNVQNSDGCLDSISKIITLSPTFSIYIPNSFTPDGDGINDTFFPIGVGINPTENYNFYIFDRWGKIIFESHLLNEHWNGIPHKIGGKKIVQQGVYSWKLEVQDMTILEKQHRLIGRVTVIY